MKDKIETFKVIWKNPRYKAIIELSLYFLFFFSLFVFAKISRDDNQIVYKNSLDQYRDKTSYNFQMDINGEILDGEFINDKIMINYNNIDYIYENEIIEPNGFLYADLLKYLDNSYIYDLIVNKEFYSKTQYNDGIVSKLYKLDDIDIEIYEKDNQIIKIKIIENYVIEIIYN